MHVGTQSLRALMIALKPSEGSYHNKKRPYVLILEWLDKA
jgi:hypothetical protein